MREDSISARDGNTSARLDLQDKHTWTVGGFQVHSSGERAVVVGGLDNLLKGAATQCMQVSEILTGLGPALMKGMQNLNLALGYEEFEGIPDV